MRAGSPVIGTPASGSKSGWGEWDLKCWWRSCLPEQDRGDWGFLRSVSDRLSDV
jgi:hypothetical protein